MKNMFKKNLTKWIPLGNYTYAETDYVVFVRGNLKTGMMHFKVKTVHAWVSFTHTILPHDLIDPKLAWDKITKEMDK